MNVTFSNPRFRAEFGDWPNGRERVPCVFEIQHDKRGWRVMRQTTGKPKFSTYGGPAAIVDGSDGRTYLLQVAQGIYGGQLIDFGSIKIMRHDFLDAEPDRLGRRAHVYAKDEPELHGQLRELIRAAGGGQ